MAVWVTPGAAPSVHSRNPQVLQVTFGTDLTVSAFLFPHFLVAMSSAPNSYLEISLLIQEHSHAQLFGLARAQHNAEECNGVITQGGWMSATRARDDETMQLCSKIALRMLLMFWALQEIKYIDILGLEMISASWKRVWWVHAPRGKQTNKIKPADYFR